MKKINIKKPKSRSKMTKAMKVRGGFAGSPSAIRPFIKNSIKNLAISAGKKVFNEGYAPMAALTKALHEEVTLKVGQKVVEMVKAPYVGSGSTQSAGNVPSVLTNGPAYSKANGLSKAGEKKAYKTSFDTGFPTSKTLLELAKENGTRFETIFDSKTYLNAAGETPADSIFPRQRLTNGHGFNLRSFHVLPDVASVSREDIKRVVSPQIGLGFSVSPMNEDQTIYGSLMEANSEITITNQSRFFPSVFKIHVIAKSGNAQDREVDLRSTSHIFNNLIVLPTVLDGDSEVGFFSPEYGSIPNYFLTDSRNFEADGNSYFNRRTDTFSWEQLNTGKGMESSSGFRELFNTVKVITKTLEPGETWQFKHSHHFGGGIDLTTDFQAVTYADTSVSAAYNYVIESKGFPCEGVLVADSNPLGGGIVFLDPREGTAPGRWFYEFRTSIKYVQAATSSSDLNLTYIPQVGVDRQEPWSKPYMHIRVFDNDPAGRLNPSKSQPFNRPLNTIAQTNSPILGNFFIPVETDSKVNFDGAQTVSDSGQAERS